MGQQRRVTCTSRRIQGSQLQQNTIRNKKKSRILVHAHASLHGRGHAFEVPPPYTDGSCWWPRARCHWLPGSCIESTCLTYSRLQRGRSPHAHRVRPGYMYVLHGATGRVTAGHSCVVCLFTAGQLQIACCSLPLIGSQTCRWPSSQS